MSWFVFHAELAAKDLPQRIVPALVVLFTNPICEIATEAVI